MRLACIQSNVVFADPAANARSAISKLESLKDEGVQFAVFPEAFLTGYCVSTRDEAKKIAIGRDHDSVAALNEAADRLDMIVVFGFAERINGEVRNAVALSEPGKPLRFYEKTHLPDLGLDKFVQAGTEMPIFETRYGKVGLLICFDLRPPEAARVLALAGAELIVLPTNWPDGAQISAEYMAISRAAENAVFFATCDRVGTENGFHFIGLSKIISPKGKVLAAAGSSEEVIQADIDLADARIKRNVVIPGKYETAVFESRRPELYGSIAEKESSVW